MRIWISGTKLDKISNICSCTEVPSTKNGAVQKTKLQIKLSSCYLPNNVSNAQKICKRNIHDVSLVLMKMDVS